MPKDASGADVVAFELVNVADQGHGVTVALVVHIDLAGDHANRNGAANFAGGDRVNRDRVLPKRSLAGGRCIDQGLALKLEQIGIGIDDRID